MKRNAAILMCVVLALATVGSRADDNHRTRTWAGALIGAAAGSIIAHNVDGVSEWAAVPAGALIGGAIARDWNNHERYQYGHYKHYPRHYSRHYWNHYSYHDDDYYDWNRHNYYYVSHHTHAKKADPEPPPVRTADLHPGVELIKVPLTHSNGMTTELSILKVSGKYIGPQGEEYESLPTAETLKAKYGM